MRITRTDLALEGVEQLQQGGDISRLDGVCAAEYTRHGYGVTDVRVATKQAAEAVGKPEGRYVTIDLRPYFRREEGFFARAARCLASELRTLLPGVGEDWPVLVAGLGNRGMTADAVGPLALESLLVTRHMVRSLPRQFRGFTPVSALVPGVLAATGMEALELLRGAVQATGCAAVIAVDALAARQRRRQPPEGHRQNHAGGAGGGGGGAYGDRRPPAGRRPAGGRSAVPDAPGYRRQGAGAGPGDRLRGNAGLAGGPERRGRNGLAGVMRRRKKAALWAAFFAI